MGGHHRPPLEEWGGGVWKARGIRPTLGKRTHERIPLRLHLEPVVDLQRGAEHVVMHGQRPRQGGVVGAAAFFEASSCSLVRKKPPSSNDPPEQKPVFNIFYCIIII